MQNPCRVCGMSQIGAKSKDGGTLFSHTVNELRNWNPAGNNDFLVLKDLMGFYGLLFRF
jgi:hypothetical protein